MKVGTDGVLLGAWADVKDTGRILDVGAGSGLIALMLAQRSGANIDAVEIEVDAYKQAGENLLASPWNDRIKVFNDSFQHFSDTTANRYDLVISNPPYFRNSLKPPVNSRSLARHDERLGYESLLKGSKGILTSSGRLAIIIPAKETVRFTELAYFEDLYPRRITWVRANQSKNYSRCLMEFSTNRTQACITGEMTIKQENNEEYSDEYVVLTREYYLMFDV